MTTGSKFVKNIDPVSDDKNWRDLIRNEATCANVWEKDWGFLAGDSDLKKEDATKLYTVDDKIRQVQEELEKLNHVNIWNTTSSGYGQKDKIELFESKINNINKNPELMPQSRKLPKTWKKGKFTAPEDPFNPLKGTTMKKK